MSQEEIEALPNEYIRKFGTFIFRVEEIQKEARTEINKDASHFEQIKRLDRLQTNEEKELDRARDERFQEEDTSYQYELEGYLKRQPRLDLKEKVGNYNYEQFREYTSLYEEAKKKDHEE